MVLVEAVAALAETLMLLAQIPGDVVLIVAGGGNFRRRLVDLLDNDGLLRGIFVEIGRGEGRAARVCPDQGQFAILVGCGDARGMALRIEGDVVAARSGVSQLGQIGCLGDCSAGGLPHAQLRIRIDERDGRAPHATDDSSAAAAGWCWRCLGHGDRSANK